jgi:hypothetical protein
MEGIDRIRRVLVMKRFHLALASAALLGLSVGATAGPMFTTNLIPLNHSGISGKATLSLNKSANTLTVNIHATGLEAGMPHAQHIHGLFDSNGNVADSTNPTLANDTDGDGFIELKEAQPAYGPILVALTSPPGGNPITGPGFPTAPNGTENFTQTYDLSSASTFNDNYSASDLFPLTDREIVIHGMSLAAGQGADGGEADGTAGYKGVLPVASGEIVRAQAVPEPADIGIMGLGLVMIGGLVMAEKRRASAKSSAHSSR